MKLHRITALKPRVFPLLSDSWLVIVRCRRGQCNIPEKFFRGHAEQTNVARFWRPRVAYPLDPKMHSVLAIRQTDNIVKVDPRLDAAQLGPVLANVDGNRFLGEDSATAVGAEDPHLRLDLFARLAASAHPVTSKSRVKSEALH